MKTFNRLTAAALALLLGAAALANAPKSYHRPRWAIGHNGYDTRAQILMARCSSIGTEGHHVQRAVCKDA